MATSSTLSDKDDDFRLTGYDMMLYAIIVVAWSTSWYPLKLQIGVVSPEVSLIWRFGSASLIMFAYVYFTGRQLLFPLHHHLRLAFLGVLMFSTNFVFFYYAAEYVASGLLTVIFSTTSIANLILGMIFLNQRPGWRVAIGGLLGITGIICVFWTEIAGASFNQQALLALGLGMIGMLSFSCGNILSAANQKRGISVVAATPWCMLYGTLWMTAVALVRGQPFLFEWTPTYIGSLIWLVLGSSVLALAVYSTLIGRIGAARTGYATVIFPIFALLISTVLEGFQWHLISVFGVILVLTGNYFVLSRKNR